jgi:hypothetical protein
MKAKGRTGKGCYKEYYEAPKWFWKGFKNGDGGTGALLNARKCTHYIGFGFDKKTKTWYRGMFLTNFEAGLSFWKQEVDQADFIVHLKGGVV